MNSLNKIVESKIISIKQQKIIIDKDVAQIYGVTTKRINEAVKNNPHKFPNGYLFELTQEEYDSLRSKNSTLENNGRGKHTKFLPKAFTEKGLYMLATIIKSKIATQTTIAIIETFAKVKELNAGIRKLTEEKDESNQNLLMKRGAELFSEIVYDDLETSEIKTTFEINFAILKFKHSVKKTRNDG